MQKREDMSPAQIQRTPQRAAPNETTTSSSSTASIEIDTRSDISLLYRAIRTLIRPLRPNLVRPGKPLPEGSPRLSAPKNRNGVDIVESSFEGVWEYTFCPKCASQNASVSGPAPMVAKGTSTSDPTSPSSPANETNSRSASGDRRPRHRIYYFNGGGFQSPPSSQHWLLLSTLSKNLSQRHSSSSSSSSPSCDNLIPEITLVSYPLAPNSPAEKSLPILQKWLSAALHSADTNHDKVTLMGDSSGGNIALSLGFWAVENYHPLEPTTTSTTPDFPLKSILAISPAVDLRNVNPAMHGADKLDPVLTISLTSRVARAWASPTANSKHLSEVADGPRPARVTDAQLSPLLNSDDVFQALVRNRVRVDGVVGTHDVLAPDALLFMRKCERCGVRGRWLVWENQMHCFPLAMGKGPLGLMEAKDAGEWIVRVLGGP